MERISNFYLSAGLLKKRTEKKSLKLISSDSKNKVLTVQAQVYFSTNVKSMDLIYLLFAVVDNTLWCRTLYKQYLKYMGKLSLMVQKEPLTLSIVDIKHFCWQGSKAREQYVKYLLGCMIFEENNCGVLCSRISH